MRVKKNLKIRQKWFITHAVIAGTIIPSIVVPGHN